MNALKVLFTDADGSVVDSTTFVRNQMGFVTGMQGTSFTETIGYDSAGYVSSANRSLASIGGANPVSISSQEGFTYDSIGNRLADLLGSYAYDSTGQLLEEDGRFQYFYDYSGNLIRKVNKSSGEVTKFEHNSENQLIAVSVFSNALNSNPFKGASYSYDPSGRRIRKHVFDSVHVSDNTKNYLRSFGYDGDEISVVLGDSGQLLARYTHSSLGTDDVLSVDITAAGVSGGLSQNPGSYRFVKDHLGSIRAVSDANGAIIQRLHYSTFGELLRVTNGSNETDITTSPAIRPQFSYSGREWDEESGLYYYRARYYDASVGRFIEQDPHPGKTINAVTVINRYIYVGNNSGNYTDPTGKFWWIAAGLVLAAMNGLYQGAMNADQARQAGFGRDKQDSVFWSGFLSGFTAGALAMVFPNATPLIAALSGIVNIALNQSTLEGTVNWGSAIGYGLLSGVVNYGVGRLLPGVVGGNFLTPRGADFMSGPFQIGVGHLFSSPLPSGVPDRCEGDACMSYQIGR